MDVIASSEAAKAVAPVEPTLMETAKRLNAEYTAKQQAASGKQGAAVDAPEGVVRAPEGAPRGENGKFEKKPETVAKEESAKREKLMQAFRRAQYPDEALSSLSPEQFLALGTKFSENQAAQDRKSQELGKKKAVESRVVEPAPAGQPQKAQDNLPTIDAKELADRLALDDDERRGIESWAKDALKPFEAQLSAATEAAEKATSERYDIGRRLGIALNSALYPEVSSYREQIEAKYDEYAASGAYEHYEPEEGVRLCARDAIEFVCKPQIDVRKKAESKAKGMGQPSAGSRQGDGALTKTDPLLEFARKRVAGVPLEEARRQVWG